MEFKAVQTEIKADLESGEFQGYASTFGNEDSGGDVVMPGAFARTLQNNKQRVRVLWHHDPYSPIGKALEMREDNAGLYVRAKIADTQLGRDVLTLMREGVVTEMSIGYDSVKERMDPGTKQRQLIELKLWEFSPVTWAMNEMAQITGVKEMGELEPLIKRLAMHSTFTKEGRVLSKRNAQLVRDAISALQALVDAADSDEKSTQQLHSTLATPDDSASGNSLAALSELSAFKSKLAEITVLQKLRDFGAEIRG